MLNDLRILTELHCIQRLATERHETEEQAAQDWAEEFDDKYEKVYSSHVGEKTVVLYGLVVHPEMQEAV